MPTEKPSQTKTIARSAGTVGIAVGASRILGLVREQVFAFMFGAGNDYDAFVVAYRIPNLLRDLFAEGALSSAFVAVFTDTKTKKGDAETWQLANNVITAVILIIGAISIAGVLLSSDLVSLITHDTYGDVPGKQALTTVMTRIMFPFLLLVSLSAVAMAILNTAGKFFVPAMASSFFNLGSIVSGVTLALLFPRWGLDAIIGMACGVIFGGLLQVGVQVPLLLKLGLRYRPGVRFTDPGLLRIMKLMVPAVIGLAAPQLTVFINTYFASGCETGSLSWLQYAYRLLWFPIGLVGVSLGVATLPIVSRHASRGDMPMLRDAYVASTVLCLVLSIPATFGLVFLGQPIIRVLFEHRSFTPAATVNTACALSLYAVGLFAFSSQKIIVPVFYALNKTIYPVIGSFITVLLNICIVLASVDTLQYRAIPLAVSLCLTFNIIFLNIALYRVIGGFDIKHVLASLLKILPAALLTGAGAWWLHRSCGALLGDMPFADLLSLFAAIVGGILFYAITLSFLNIKEVAPLRSKLLQLIRGQTPN